MVTRGKPAPDLFLHVAREMGVAPENCLGRSRTARPASPRPSGGHARVCLRRRLACRAAPACLPHSRRCSPTWSLTTCASFRTCSQAEQARPSPAVRRKLACAIDIGTGSARAGIFDAGGNLLGRADYPIVMNLPQPGHAEHDSEDIWRAVCAATRGALRQSRRQAATRSSAFPSTPPVRWSCATGKARQLGVSTGGGERWDTIVWLDHRALAEADDCTATGHRVLDYLGGVMSPEMQTPKLMWLKRNLPETWDARRAILRPRRLPDLAGDRLRRPARNAR